MQAKLVVSLALLAIISFTSANPILLEDEDGQQYILTPVVERGKREVFGQGGGNGKTQSGYVGINNPNGSGGSIGYHHQNGYGHTVSVDGRVPVWSNKNRYGESTLNVGGGATQHFGGPGGNRNLEKHIGVNFNHRW
ncbi:hypothetical protein ABEB36_013004 [Hypothenemus hampei]|uniref:Attacin C-terminal domain-containing protein n=1 Tax=Hypothenemus hampei TaxID=57062 RepID=A0ABD1E6H9_HYPHA